MNRLKVTHLLTIAVLILLAACGPAAPEAAPSPGPDLRPPLQEAATSTPAALPENYPPPAVAPLPTATLPADYPAPPTMAPTVDPYPGGMVWVIRPVGIQCEEGTAPGYTDLRETVATMTAAGINVIDSQMTDMMVTAVCGAPTSAHFRLQIDAADLQTAESMGWNRES